MTALDFPSSPTLDQKYPQPPVPGVPVYRWDGEKWTTVGGTVGSTGAFDGTPLADGTAAPGASTLWSRGDHRHPTDPGIAAGDTALQTDINAKVAKAGDTMTGTLAIDGSSLTIDFHRTVVNDGSFSGISFYAGPAWLSRCDIYLAAGAETGGNAGSDFEIDMFDDDGVGSRVALNIKRSTGLMTIVGDPVAPLGVATKQYVDSHTAAATVPATAAEYRAGTSTKLLSVDQVWAAAALVTLADAASVSPNLANGIDFIWAVGAAARTLADPTNAKVGQKGIIYLSQVGATGSITTFGAMWKFAGGIKPVMTPTAGAIDAISYAVINSTTIACTFLADFK